MKKCAPSSWESPRTPEWLLISPLAMYVDVRFELVGVATSNFNELGGSWAISEATQHVRVPSRVSRSLGFEPSWKLGAAAAACLVAVGISLPFLPLHLPQVGGTGSSAGITSASDIAQDNHLCASIDQRLHSGADVIVIPISELRQEPGRRDAHKAINVVVN